jgi:RNA polymerase-interacting CarD/CdnL/TRCF family regulator
MNIKPSASSFASISKGDDLIPGDFIYTPNMGVTIFSGRELIEIGGVSSTVAIFNPVEKADAKYSVPEATLKKRDFRRLHSVEELQEVFDVLTAKPKSLGGAWRAKERSYGELAKQGSLKDFAQIIHYGLSGVRRAPPKPGKKTECYDAITKIPGAESMSYSERQVIDDALDRLVPVLQFRCGLAKKDARDMILKAVVHQGFSGHKELKDKAGTSRGLDSDAFKRLYGITKDEAAVPREGGSISLPPPANDLFDKQNNIRPEAGIAPAKAVGKPAAPAIAKADRMPMVTGPQPEGGRAQKARVQIRTGRTEKQQALDARRRTHVLAANKDAYHELMPLMPTTPHAHTILRLAARHLERPEDLTLAAKLWLVKRGERLTHKQAAEEHTEAGETYAVRVARLKETIEKAAEKENIRGIEKVTLSTEDRQSPLGKVKAETLVKTENKAAYAKLKDDLPVTANVKAVFNLAAQTLDDPAEFELAARVWLVKKEKRLSHAEAAEHFGIPSDQYESRITSIREKLETAAKERDLKAFDKVCLRLSDKVVRAEKTTVSMEAPAVEMARIGEKVVFFVTLPEGAEHTTGGVDLQVNFTDGAAQASVSGKYRNREGERKKLPEFRSSHALKNNR